MRDDEPGIDEVLRVARSVGLTLSPEEAAILQRELPAALQGMADVMAMALEEERPQVTYADRAPGRRPTAAEDRFNAWLWKCEIKGAASGPLAGKTVSLKDHLALAGAPLTLGAKVMESYIPDFDATVVARVLAAGGTITGKHQLNGPTNESGWGLPSDYQRPQNPHAPDHWTGGSSSGSAVAVAAGEVDISIGGDQGGSIRIPAAYCGTYGLKPTFGLISHFGANFGSDQSVDTVGPMALRAEDLALTLDAIAGYDPLDQRQDRSVPLEVRSLATLRDGVKGLRIGVLDEGFTGVDPDVRDAVSAAIDVLVAAGATAERVSVPEHVTANLVNQHALDPEGNAAIFDTGFFGTFARTYYPAAWIDAAYRLFHEHVDQIVPRRKLGLLLGRYARERYHGTLYAKAQNARPTFRRAFDRVLERFDVLAMPTVPDVAPKFVEVEPQDYLEAAFRPRPFVKNTRTYNYTGHPALSIPCGKSGGLPIGMQLVGRFYEDPLLLRVAYAFEHSVDWAALTSTARGS